MQLYAGIYLLQNHSLHCSFETKKRASSAHIWWLSTGNRDSFLIDSPQARTNRTTYLARFPWLARSRISFAIFIHLTFTQFFIPDRPGRWDRHWVPKRRLLNFRRRGNSEKNTNYNLLNSFWVACKSSSLVAVACFLPGRAKDLPAPRYRGLGGTQM